MRRRRRKKLPEAPLTLEIEKLSHEGRGIAHSGGKVVFVEGALPGETVEAVLTGRRDSYDEARITSVHKPSPHRVQPPCTYAAVCGGCSLQHFDPAAQLDFKQATLLEKLGHATGASFKPLAPLTGPVFGYRRKARLAVRYVPKKEQVLVGFREKHSTFITHMDSCEVLDLRLAGLLPALSGLIRGLDAYRHIPQVEVAAGDPDLPGCTVALVFRHLEALSAGDLDKLAAFGSAKGIAIYLQPGGVESVHRLVPEAGRDRLYYRLPDFALTLGFHPMDFTQVNGDINRVMIAQALALLDLQPGDAVLDLFCGLGNFTLPLARHCLRATGVEGAESMVERARENAAANAIGNTAFHCADLAHSFAAADWLQEGFNKVLLDPPRSGACEILPAVVALAPSCIVYVSCNPATLSRDAEYLSQHGYTLATAGAMDMFPQTAHVEAMALFLADTRS